MYVYIGKTVVVKHTEILTILDFRELFGETNRDQWLNHPRTSKLVESDRVKSLVVTPSLTYASPYSPQNLIKKINETSREQTVFKNNDMTVGKSR